MEGHIFVNLVVQCWEKHKLNSVLLHCIGLEAHILDTDTEQVKTQVTCMDTSQPSFCNVGELTL